MEMKLTNKEMKDLRSTLIEIGGKEGIDPVLGVKIARTNYDLMKMLAPVEEAEESLLDEFALKDEKGNMVRADGGGIRLKNGKKYHEELQRLNDDAAEVNLAKFTMSELKKMSPTPNQILSLMPLLELDEK